MLKNVEFTEVETPRFTVALFGLGPSPFLSGGVIERHLETWSQKQLEIVSEIMKNVYVDDLISGATTTATAREMKTAATEIFADTAFELHKWHSNVPDLESAETCKNPDQTQERTARKQSELLFYSSLSCFGAHTTFSHHSIPSLLIIDTLLPPYIFSYYSSAFTIN